MSGRHMEEKKHTSRIKSMGGGQSGLTGRWNLLYGIAQNTQGVKISAFPNRGQMGPLSQIRKNFKNFMQAALSQVVTQKS